ncbi:MAG TPA: hypothetical protein VF735_02715 [Pyrinomonadaceae bacterium]|jgi:hypothetical protein
MFGSSILEVAIGMIFVYLLMSLICSAANEIIESFLKNRATDLERGIRELFNQEGGGNMVANFYKHPLIHGLFTGEYGRELHKKIGIADYFKSTNLPAYIPAGNFTAALIDLVLHPPVTTKIEREDSPAKLAAKAEAAQTAKLAAKAATAQAAKQDPQATEPQTPVTPAAPAAATAITMADIQMAIDLMGDTEVGRALRALAEQAGDNVQKLRTEMEAWFNSSMDRVSGWYKRRTKWIILGLGFVLTVILNVNSITIATSLYNDPTLRSLVVAQAETFKNNNSSQGTDSDKNSNAAQDNFMRNKAEIQSLGLPIGWPNGFRFAAPSNGSEAWKYLLEPFFGWLLTAAAISMGAPFWFDLLNKIMVVRSTVKPHEKSPEESSEDRQTKK